MDHGYAITRHEDSEGATPLWLAVKQKHVDIASLLLDRGRIDVNHFHEGCTPLLEAVGQQDEAMVELLLANPNVDVNFPDLSGDTALHIATRGGTVWRPYPSIPILKSLLRREDIQWNMPNMFGVTPFDVAARLFNTKWSDSSVIAAFLEKDAAVARSDQGPLCRFCFLLYHELRESFMRKRCKPLRFLKQSVEKSECELCRLLYLYALRAHSNEDVWSWLELAGSEFPHFELRVVTSSYGSHGEKFTRRWLTKDTERDMPLWWSREPLTPKDSVNTIQRWVDECSGSSEHHLCSSTAQNFPKRLLELDFANTEKLVKLIECCEGQSGRYVAFSHCWGASGAVPKTEAKNYKKHLAGLSFEALPRSFRDVADMCWSLGIRHLWIDSLCIIQDDEKDWQHQSTEMTAIYQNAFITIAATASSSSEEGLRIRRQLADHIPTPDPQETLAVRPRADPRVLRQSPLYERGWTLQETVISRRVVHFASDQLYWVCQSKSMSEDGMHNADVRPLPRISGEIPSEAWDIWWSWVEDYSRRRLSFFSDKLPAIAGLTRKFEELSHATPAVGLWMEDIHYSLLWWPTRPVSRLPFIPSWSWASVDGPVKPMYESRCLRELKPLATIGPQSLTVQWTGEELTSRISHATLRVTGRLRKANFRPGYSRIYHTGAGHSCHNEPGYQPHAQLTNDTSYHPRVSCVMFDAGFAKKKTPLDKIWCLEILEEPGAFQGFLILEPTSEAQREYRRIGVGYVSSAPSIIDDDFFSCAAMEEVVLV
ncbi:heterokaryon incompatibility protein-domain-containing protein [Cercophora newfieldiana]|uniref:Heterokaryon incompatibility protein-domain-containing protein n=1 Tax=Cercophora newfieldiana TaxID=92897 RepID=A0AA39YBZ0_9PEZI|nr:heterokaryon incompatibility protein-domain-containing protein [Cercophora newfieldiana]